MLRKILLATILIVAFIAAVACASEPATPTQVAIERSTATAIRTARPTFTPTKPPTATTEPATATPEAGLPEECEFEQFDSQIGVELKRSEFSPLPEGETGYPILGDRAQIVFNLKGEKLNISVTADGEVQKRWSAIRPESGTFVVILFGPNHEFVIFGPLFLTACQGGVWVNDRHLGDTLSGDTTPAPTPITY